MTVAIEGGRRDRFIEEAVQRYAHGILDDLDWFDEGRDHTPITVAWLLPVAERDKDEKQLNTLECNSVDHDFAYIELGSLLADTTHRFDFDFFATDDAIGKQLIGDLRDGFRGRMPSINRTSIMVPVYDYSQDPLPGTPEFFVEVDRITGDRATNTTRVWERHWHSLRVEVIDEAA